MYQENGNLTIHSETGLQKHIVAVLDIYTSGLCAGMVTSSHHGSRGQLVWWRLTTNLSPLLARVPPMNCPLLSSVLPLPERVCAQTAVYYDSGRDMVSLCRVYESKTFFFVFY